MLKLGFRNAEAYKRESKPTSSVRGYSTLVSATNNLQQRGMALVRTHGKEYLDRSEYAIDPRTSD